MCTLGVVVGGACVLRLRGGSLRSFVLLAGQGRRARDSKQPDKQEGALFPGSTSVVTVDNAHMQTVR